MTDTYQTGGPPRFMHQRRGLRRAIDSGGVFALLFDPGTGKTATVLDYAGLLALKSPTGEARVLVVCPLAAVDTWILQAGIFMSPMVSWWAEAVGGSLRNRADTLANRGGNGYHSLIAARRRVWPHAARALNHDLAWAWAVGHADGTEPTRPVTSSQGPDALDGPRVVMCITNIDTFTSRAPGPKGHRLMSDLMLDAVRRFEPDLLVVDESHKIKGHSGNASRLLGRISRYVKRRAVLTGTVMPHGPLDVFGQWRFLDPYAFGDEVAGTRHQATWGSFRSRFAVTGGWMGQEVIGYRNLDEMQTIMARNAVVARKDQVLDLPPTTDVIVPVLLAPAEAKAYKEMKDTLAVQLASGGLATVGNRLTQMLRLRQITSGHLPDDTGTSNVIGTSKINTMASLICDTLTGETRVVVFCFFIAEIDALVDALAADAAAGGQPTEVMKITGGTSTEDRRLLRKRFGSDDPARMVLVAQVGTISLAVNELVTASHAVFGSMSQQRDDYVQARDRLDRQGQTKPITFWHVLAPKTVDEVILKAHRDRTSLEDAMLRHVAGEEKE